MIAGGTSRELVPLFLLHLLEHDVRQGVSGWSLPQESLTVQVALHLCERVFADIHRGLQLRRELDRLVTCEREMRLSEKRHLMVRYTLHYARMLRRGARRKIAVTVQSVLRIVDNSDLSVG